MSEGFTPYNSVSLFVKVIVFNPGLLSNMYCPMKAQSMVTLASLSQLENIPDPFPIPSLPGSFVIETPAGIVTLSRLSQFLKTCVPGITVPVPKSIEVNALQLMKQYLPRVILFAFISTEVIEELFQNE